MTKERKIIKIPEITRVEGHAAVNVDIVDGRVEGVELQVFEGMRYFEKLVVSHHFEEMPHITSRVCAICSTGHVLAAAFAVEHILGYQAGPLTRDLRELMHLGMIIESHATHIYALALPDYLGAPDLATFASKFNEQFQHWTKLRSLGSAIQSCIGGRAFHPVNLHAGGFSSLPTPESLRPIHSQLDDGKPLALKLCELLSGFKPKVSRSSTPIYMCLGQEEDHYGYFGESIVTSDGWQESVQNYNEYLKEEVVPYSHAKRSTAKGRSLMVGPMARLRMFGKKLGNEAREVWANSALAQGDNNSLWNNLAQSIELLEAIERCKVLLTKIEAQLGTSTEARVQMNPQPGRGVGAIECPRGTLYHCYTIDEEGKILAADMITPSAQNSYRIELDIREVVEQSIQQPDDLLIGHLETLIRAYDPCNTCATHNVKIRRSQKNQI